MDKIDKNQKIMLILLGIGLIIVMIIKIVSFYNKKDTIDNSIKIVTDQNKFFEVSSCIDKYITYSQNDDYDNLINIISSEYIKENNISQDNIFNYIKKFDFNDVFSSRKMYYQQLDKSIYKYYVYGTYRQELMDSVGQSQNYYFIVYLYTNNMTFSIEPYDGEIFEG